MTESPLSDRSDLPDRSDRSDLPGWADRAERATRSARADSTGRPDWADQAGPWLGVDLGEARVGLALSDPGLILAMPLATLARDGRAVDALADHLAALARERGAGRVIVGWPLNMDGSAGPKAAEAADLAAALRAGGVAGGGPPPRPPPPPPPPPNPGGRPAAP
ncbi:MAG: Holliday junction resolvase RuvX, partial [Bifidobacteriaceae bacterium]|nr:Holliday junction resolvase RuvX [Bifidobacteriaceae bacterium]